jgi:DMSO/TMAO reductase YedYZ molybdopterin-dependent catalytic subunit
MTTLQPPAPAPDPSSSSASVRVSRRAAIFGSVGAALAAGFGMYALRSALQVRSVPERLMEWLLLFVTPEQFEAALQRFGFDAKRYGLAAAILGMLGVLSCLGYLALRRGWRLHGMLALGMGLWLFVMLVVMPLTSAGPFALDLLDGKRAAIGGYLAVALTFAAVLALAGARAHRRFHQDTPPAAWQNWSELGASPGVRSAWLQPRRGAIALLGSAGAAYLATYLAVRMVPRGAGVETVMLEDPQEPVPSGGIDTPNPHPNVVGTPPGADAAIRFGADAGPQPSVEAATSAQPTAVATSAGRLPEPAPEREVVRDKDGAVLPGGHVAGQLVPAISSNTDFYVVTKNAGGDPVVHPDNWRLLIDGEIDRPVQLDYATLRKMPAVEMTKTLECISNYVGKPELAPFGAELIGTAVWKGVRVRDILRVVGGPKSTVGWVAVLSADEFTSALPLDAVVDPNTILVYEMNGEVLPREHGYPARLLVPGRYGMKNAKWVIGLRLLRREFSDWYGQRNWSKHGIVQTMSRIDVPVPGASLPSGQQTVAGIAYAGARGIQRVEWSSDDGRTWQTAELLEPAPGEDRWVRWRGTFTLASPGASVVLVARATDSTGEVQTREFSLPEPDGGTGWPHVEVHAG